MADNKVNAKDKNKKGKLTKHMVEFLDNLRSSILKDIDNRSVWKRKLVTANNQRLGVKRLTNRPYPGAPNIPLPEADKLIEKKKPVYVLSLLSQKKKVLVRLADGVQNNPELRQKVLRAEKGLNFVLNNKIDLTGALTLGADDFLEKGHCIFKVVESFTDEKIHRVIDLNEFEDEIVKELHKLKNNQLSQVIAEKMELDAEDEEDKEIIDDLISQFRKGKKILEVDIPMVESYPDILVRPPENITPPSYAKDIWFVERLNDDYYLTNRELEEGARTEEYDKVNVDKFLKERNVGKGTSTSDNDLIETNKEHNEGVLSDNEDELNHVDEIYCWYKPENSDRYQRWVFKMLSDVGSIEDSIIAKFRFPYEFKHWNYVKHDNEAKDLRWHASRGLPERIRALQEFMEKGINNMLIRDEINNAPTYTVLSNSLIQSNSVRFIPGQKIKVNSHNEISRLDDQQTVDISSERIVQLLKATAEEYMGSTDQLFKNSTNKGGGKTLGEVKAGIAQSSVSAQLDVLRWTISVQKLYTMVFQLMKERLGKSIFIDNVEITRDDFDFEAEIIPNGSIDLADENLRTQKAMMRVQFVLTAPPDIVTAEDKYNAVFDWLEAEGVRDPDRYVTDPKIIQQQQQQQMQQEDQVLAQQEQDLSGEIGQVQQRANVEANAGTANQGTKQSPSTPAR